MTGIRNKRWSRENVTIGQVWHARRYPDEHWIVTQCHHIDEMIELSRIIRGATRKQTVGVTELRKYWERVS